MAIHSTRTRQQGSQYGRQGLPTALNELPRCFSPGLARQLDIGFSRKLLRPATRVNQCAYAQWERFLAKAYILFTHSPRAKAPGQFIFG
jgi:hypothetical protein